jgi:hypothetical protein
MERTGTPQVRALIRVHGGDGQQDLASLQDWLAGESTLRGRIARERSGPGPAEMGAASDVLVAALGDGGAVTALAASLGTWLVTRRSRVRLTVTGPDERSVEVDLRSRDVEALLNTVLAQVTPPPRDGSE